MNFYPILRPSFAKPVISLSNFSPASGGARAPVNVYFIHSDGMKWNLRKWGELQSGQIFRMDSEELLKESPARSVFLFMTEKNLPDTLSTLPEVEIGFQVTLPAWRANIGVRTDKAEATYQGEFPQEMSHLKPGSFFSLCPMFQVSEGVKNHLMFINMYASPEIRESHLVLRELLSRKIVKEYSIISNTINHISLEEGLLEEGKQYYFSSATIAGVPVYLTYASDLSELSLEHTHPPTEFTAGKSSPERWKALKKMKDYYIHVRADQIAHSTLH